MKSLAKNTIYNVAYKVLTLVFPLITSAYISRVLMPQGIGTVAYAQNICSYFILFASLGIPTYGIKAIAEVANDKEKLNSAYSSLLVLNVILTAISSIVYIASIYIVPQFRENLPLYWACGINIFLSCINIDWLYSGLEEYDYIVKRSILIKIILIIAILVFVKTKDDYVVYALISSFAMAGNYLFNVVHARKYVKFTVKNLNFSKYIVPVVTLGTVLILGTLYNKIDITMLGLMIDENAVGYYSNAHKVIDIIISVCAAFTAAFLPRLSYYFKNEREKIPQILNKGVSAISFIVFPAIIGIILLAPSIVKILFGEMFLKSGSIIRVFAIVIFFRSFGDLFCHQLLIASGNEKKRILANIVSTVINIVLNFLLIPILNEIGAAIASIISEAFVNIYLFIILKRKLRFSVNYKSMLSPFIASLIMIIGIIPAKLIGGSEIVYCVVTVLCCSIIYLTANFLLKNDFMRLILYKCKIRLNKRGN